MHRLGYERFVAQGGDWGNADSEQMALQRPAGLLGIATNMSATVPPDDITMYWLTNTAISSARRYWDNRETAQTASSTSSTSPCRWS